MNMAEQVDLHQLAKQLARLIIDEMRGPVVENTKEWYDVRELAVAMKRRPYTIREKWCNTGRIECVKDPSGNWRIPGREYRRLVNGGFLRPKSPAIEEIDEDAAPSIADYDPENLEGIEVLTEEAARHFTRPR